MKRHIIFVISSAISLTGFGQVKQTKLAGDGVIGTAFDQGFIMAKLSYSMGNSTDTTYKLSYVACAYSGPGVGVMSISFENGKRDIKVLYKTLKKFLCRSIQFR